MGLENLQQTSIIQRPTSNVQLSMHGNLLCQGFGVSGAAYDEH